MKGFYFLRDTQLYVDEKTVKTSARPRRLSEVDMANQKKPIPEGSSFFIFSNTNRYHGDSTGTPRFNICVNVSRKILSLKINFFNTFFLF